MLILVAVTVRIGRDQGLFDKAREAKASTAYSAEEEKLAMYMYGEGVYNAATGEIDLEKLKTDLLASGEWETVNIDGTKLTAVGKQSGEQHIINANGTTGEQQATGIVGTYHGIGDLYFSGNPTLKFDDNGQATQTFYAEEEVDSTTGEIYKGDDEVSTGPYTYDEKTKTGTLTLTDNSSPGYTYTYNYTFNLINVGDNLLVELLEDVSENNQWSISSVWAKNKCGKIIDLGTSTYVNGTKTIEFVTSVEDGVEIGRFTLKQDGNVLNSMDGYYLCYNGKIIIDDEVASISDDLSTITYDGETYTKQ